jgi:CheY-like chemotaxis protein
MGSMGSMGSMDQRFAQAPNLPDLCYVEYGYGDDGPATADDARAPGDGRQRLILAIDDSATVRAVIEYSFSRIGVAVAAFPDGIAALQALTEGRTPVPDLVLLDIGLPHMDGYAVATILRTNPALALTPIVMLSGRDGLMDRMRSRMVGARGFIAKPFRTSALIAIVCEYLGIGPAGAQAGPDMNG